MTYSKQDNLRISNSVTFTEGVMRNSTSRSRGWSKHIPRQNIMKGKVVTAQISAGGTGEIEVYKDGVAQGTPYQDVSFDWLFASGDIISVDQMVVAEYFEDEDIWSITGAECEPVPAPAPPGHGNDIVAAGTVQGDAQGLSFTANRVITVNAGVADGVRLPATFEQEDHCKVRNAHATDTLKVYPASGDFINEELVNVHVTIAALSSLSFMLVESDHWIS